MTSVIPYIVTSVLFLVYHKDIISATNTGLEFWQLLLVGITCILGMTRLRPKLKYFLRHHKELGFHIPVSILLGLLVAISFNNPDITQGSFTIKGDIREAIIIVLFFLIAPMTCLLLLLPNDEQN